MANYDDIFNASSQKGTEDKSFVSFNKEEWAAQKKQERESAFAMIDETAQRMANDGGLFQGYLDVQARFDRYSVGNAVLITAQKADATQLSDFKGWKNNGVFIKKGESGIVLLEPGEEYTKEDGTVGVSYNSKKVFDISQTTAKAKDRPAMKRDERLLLKAIIHNAPCPIEISQKLPENINAVYRPDDKKIYVRPGLEAGDIFRGISQELAHAHLDDGAYKRSDHAFTAYCVSYVLCSRYNVPKDTYGRSRGRNGSYSTNYQLAGRELMTPDEVRMLDNRYALLFIRGERPIRDLKYDILHHPNVALTTDGSAPAYTHGEDTRSIASMAFSFDKKAVKNAEKMEAEKHEFLLYSEEELEELLDEKEKKGNEET